MKHDENLAVALAWRNFGLPVAMPCLALAVAHGSNTGGFFEVGRPDWLDRCWYSDSPEFLKSSEDSF